MYSVGKKIKSRGRWINFGNRKLRQIERNGKNDLRKKAPRNYLFDRKPIERVIQYGYLKLSLEDFKTIQFYFLGQSRILKGVIMS